MSRKYKKFINEEISFLKLTIKHLIKENNEIKHKINDLKITYQSDKDLLIEYYNQISNKDLKVKKLLNVIEQLKKRLNPFDDLNHNILLKSKFLKTNNYTVYTNDDYYVTEKAISIEKANFIKKNKIKSMELINNISNYKVNEDDEFYSNYYIKQNKIIKELKQLKSKLSYLNNLIIENEYEEDNNNFINIKNPTYCNNLDSILRLNNNLNENDKKEIILLSDNNNNIWELILEENLTEENLKNENINCKEVNNSNEELNAEISFNSSFLEEDKSL
jgi:hypothetical protein